MIRTTLKDLLIRTDKAPLNEIMKMAWYLMIYNLPITFIRDLEADCTRYLKQWLGITRSITVSVLYRNKDH